MRVALVHDWLTGMRGGERCLEAFICLYPDADIFTLVHIPGTTSPEIDRRVKEVSFLNRVPGVAKRYRYLLPLFPSAARSLDLSGYDLVISLSHAAAKNVRVPQGVPHVSYCFTPMRYIWDQAPFYFSQPALLAARPLIQQLRRWDRAGADQVTHFIGISDFIAARIRLFYQRRADVIPPPVRMSDEVQTRLSSEEQAFFSRNDEPFFLCAGALMPYKRIDVAVRAFTKLGLPLWIAGKGTEERRLKEIAGPRIRFLGGVSDAMMWECYRRCQALVFPGIEDFGIVPVECLAAGRPVIGVAAGGLRQSIVGLAPWNETNPVASNLAASAPCGVFIPKRGYGDPDALAAAVDLFRRNESLFLPEVARKQAAHFSYAQFFKAWSAFAGRAGIDSGASLGAGELARQTVLLRSQGASC